MNVLVTRIFTKITIGLSLFFNIFGIYLLTTVDKGHTTQIRIITSLSIADVLNSIGFAIRIAAEEHIHEYREAFNIIWAQRTGIYHAWYAMHYLLTIDRFFGCNFPLRYSAVVTRNKVRNVLLISWCTAVSFGGLYCLLDTEQIKLFYIDYVWTQLDVGLLIVFIGTYSSIFYRKMQRNLKFGSQDGRSGNKQFFIVSTTILATFIIFEFSSTIVYKKMDPENKLTNAIATLLWNINILADPLIYIFLQPEFRKAAFNKIRRVWGVCNICRLRGKVYHFNKEVPNLSWDFNNLLKHAEDKPSCASITQGKWDTDNNFLSTGSPKKVHWFGWVQCWEISFIQWLINFLNVPQLLTWT